MYRFLRGLSIVSSKGILLVISDSVSGVSERLINLPVNRDVHGLLSSSFKDKKFNLDVFSEIPKVF